MDYWSKQLFSYCERGLSGAFWAEPFNALSNGAFWIASVAALVVWLRMPHADRRIIDAALIALLAIIGTGSFLFHTFATRWAVLADVIPITMFMLVYLGYALKRFLGWNWPATALGLAAFIAALYFAETQQCEGGPCLNGSLGYVPAFAVLLVIGGVLQASAHPAGGSLVAAGLTFAVSLTFRTIDRTFCAATEFGIAYGPIGSHFIWHILNATLLYILVRAAIVHGGFTAAVLRDNPL